LNEEHQRHDEDRRIKDVGLFVALAETIECRVPCFEHDFFVKFVAGSNPFIALWARKRSLFCKSKTYCVVACKIYIYGKI